MEKMKIGLKPSITAGVILFSLFFVTSCQDEPVLLPVLNTIQAADANITSTTAKLKGEIQILGNQKIVEYGIEISKSPIFTPPVRKGYTTTPAIGQFEVDFTGLDPNTIYYYKAYTVINTAHVYSQNALNFTTKN
jgi:hypothetical protein